MIDVKDTLKMLSGVSSNIPMTFTQYLQVIDLITEQAELIEQQQKEIIKLESIVKAYVNPRENDLPCVIFSGDKDCKNILAYLRLDIHFDGLETVKDLRNKAESDLATSRKWGKLWKSIAKESELNNAWLAWAKDIKKDLASERELSEQRKECLDGWAERAFRAERDLLSEKTLRETAEARCNIYEQALIHIMGLSSEIYIIEQAKQALEGVEEDE